MPELMTEISAEVKQFLGSGRPDVYQCMSRTAIIQVCGTAIEIDQRKMLSLKDEKSIQKDGVSAFTSAKWFNDVDWMQQPHEEEPSARKLSLSAAYPMEYFDETPRSGSYRDNKWLDQYESISGFGSDGEINSWNLQFVAPNSRKVTNLQYPEDPTALSQYNERYQQYLQTLTETSPTINYYRGWDRMFSEEYKDSGLVLGGMALAGISLNEVLAQGTSEIEGMTDNVRLVFNYEKRQDDHVGRDIVITNGSEATTEPYWVDEDSRQPASEELLENALKLVRDTTRS